MNQPAPIRPDIHPADCRHRPLPHTRRLRRPLPLLLVCAVLAACGGGGDDAGAAQSTRAGLSTAPSMPRGPAPVPSVSYSCGNVSLGATRSDDIEVPAGQVCVLQGTRVDGNIKLNNGSVLDARDVTVIGNIQGEGAASALLAGASSLTGSVQLKQGGGATIVDARINGDLQFDSNRSALRAEGNRVRGNIQAVGNRGGLTLTDNVAIGNLQCKENQPAPTGSGNRAASKEDQCQAL